MKKTGCLVDELCRECRSQTAWSGEVVVGALPVAEEAGIIGVGMLVSRLLLINDAHK